jgi:alanine dehydrogenase
MVLYLTEEDVHQLLTMQMTIEAVEEAFRLLGIGQAENLPRRRLHSSKGMFNIMSASLSGAGYMGYKCYTVFPGKMKFRVFLHSSANGELLAIMDADLLGQMRTGAASAVATRWMARADSQVVGIIGTGWQARSQLEAICQVRSINKVLVYGRNAQNLQKFCLEMQEKLKISCLPTQFPEEVVEAADVLTTITSSDTPVFQGSKLQPGTHVNAAGSNFIVRRELDETAVRKCRSIVVDSKEQAKLECGEFLYPLERGRLTWDQIRELDEVVSSRVLPRTNPKDITLFKSHGLALEDIAVAARLYQMAVAQKIGQRVNFGK